MHSSAKKHRRKRELIYGVLFSILWTVPSMKYFYKNISDFENFSGFSDFLLF